MEISGTDAERANMGRAKVRAAIETSLSVSNNRHRNRTRSEARDHQSVRDVAVWRLQPLSIARKAGNFVASNLAPGLRAMGCPLPRS